MKLSNLLPVLLLIFISFSVQAQSIKDFKKEMKEITSALTLDKAQVDQLMGFYTTRVNNLQSIEPYRSSDEKDFRSKRRAIYQAADVSIKLMLTQEQLDKYKLYKKGVREKRAKKIAKIRKSTYTSDDLLDAEYGVID